MFLYISNTMIWMFFHVKFFFTILQDYTLFYDYQPLDMEVNTFSTKASRKYITGQTFTLINNLRACESYKLIVAVSRPGRCRPSQSIVMQTGEGMLINTINNQALLIYK